MKSINDVIEQLSPEAQLVEAINALTRYTVARHSKMTDGQIRELIDELKSCIEVLTEERARIGKRLPDYPGLPRLER